MRWITNIWAVPLLGFLSARMIRFSKRRSLQFASPWFFVMHRRWINLGTVLLTLAALGASAASAPKRVLLLFHESAGSPSIIKLEPALRSQLRNSEEDSIEIYTEYLDASRFASASHNQLFREYLQEKYRNQPPDVIYTTAATSFAGIPPNELMPGIPVVFDSISTWSMPLATVGTNMTGIVAYFDYRGTLDLIFKLLPDTRRIVVICNFSASEQSFLKQVEKVSQLYAQRASFEFWTNQPMTEMQTAVSGLPAGTVVLSPGVVCDVSGPTVMHMRALEVLFEKCSVPAFGFLDAQVGSGAVGGSVVDYERLGVLAGQRIQQILDGAPVSSLPITEVTNGTPMFDCRALHRWGIREALLPPGSVLRYHRPVLWEAEFWKLYGWWIAGAVVFCGLHTAVVIGLLGNIRARRRAVQNLRDSEERMTLAVEAAQFGLWEWNHTANQVWGSERWRSLFGFTAGEEVTFEKIIQRIHPDERERVQHDLQLAMGNTSGHTAEFRIVRPDGTQRWVVFSGRVFPAADGTLTRIVGAAIDITDRKEAENQARQQSVERARADEKFRLAVESSPSGIVLTNAQGQIVLVNGRVEEMFGYARAELLGQAVELLVPERFLGNHAHHRARFLDAPGVRVMGTGRDFFARRKDGTEFPVEIGLNPVDTAEGRLVLAVVVDITSRRQAEAETRRLREELAHVTRVTTLSELSGSLAHELNQPLGAILRNAEAAELLLHEPQPDLEELRAIVADIVKDDQRAGAVIDRMRAMLKRRSLERLPVSVESFVLDVIALVRSDAAVRHVALAHSIPPGLPHVFGDRIQLSQVLLNLIMNGMEAVNGAADGARNIIIAAKVGSPGTVEISVTDSGSGIPPELMTKIFDPFVTTKAKGMGIGLAVSRTIIENHGGKLWAENNARPGATFFFSLPAAKETGE